MTHENVALTEEEVQSICEFQDKLQDLNRQLQEIENERIELSAEFRKHLDDIARANIKEYDEWRKREGRTNARIFIPMISADNRYLSIADMRRR